MGDLPSVLLLACAVTSIVGSLGLVFTPDKRRHFQLTRPSRDGPCMQLCFASAAVILFTNLSSHSVQGGLNPNRAWVVWPKLLGVDGEGSLEQRYCLLVELL